MYRRLNNADDTQPQPLGGTVDFCDDALVLHWIFDDTAFAYLALTHFKLWFDESDYLRFCDQ